MRRSRGKGEVGWPCKKSLTVLELSPLKVLQSPGGGRGGGWVWLPSDLDDVFGVGVGEALELVLVQVHDEQLVCGSQLHRHLGELLVKVAHVTAGFLTRERKGEDTC